MGAGGKVHPNGSQLIAIETDGFSQELGQLMAIHKFSLREKEGQHLLEVYHFHIS